MSENEIKEDSHLKFLSLEFHTRFFPALLFGRLKPGRAEGVGFTSTLDWYVLFFICLILIVIGVPNVLVNKSIVGWIISIIGFAGVVLLFIGSILSFRGNKPSYDDFLIGIFLFFPSLGLSAGIFTGSLEHAFWKGLLIGSAGLVGGYIIGILSGLWFQYLGWLAGLLNYAAYLATFGMLFVDLVILW
jgi:hypothetical protein